MVQRYESLNEARRIEKWLKKQKDVSLIKQIIQDRCIKHT
jgi:hypothetical protein